VAPPLWTFFQYLPSVSRAKTLAGCVAYVRCPADAPCAAPQPVTYTLVDTAVNAADAAATCQGQGLALAQLLTAEEDALAEPVLLAATAGSWSGRPALRTPMRAHPDAGALRWRLSGQGWRGSDPSRARHTRLRACTLRHGVPADGAGALLGD
jgi:hypothetical protein